MADVKSLAEQLVGLTVKEVQELADVLKSEYGIEPAAAAVVVAADGGAGDAARRHGQPEADAAVPGRHAAGHSAGHAAVACGRRHAVADAHRRANPSIDLGAH